MKPRVFVIDDDPNLSRLVKDILEKTESYDVGVENRPFHALASAREFKPNVILLDVDMPGKDGGDLAREMRADSCLHRTPIIFLTALISKQEAARKSSCGGMRYLAKPASPATLIPAIEQALARVA